MVYFAVSAGMNALKLYEFKIKKVIFRNANLVKWLNDLLAIFSMLLLHGYRLSHTGKVCSGDYAIEENDKSEYLSLRGRLLLMHLFIIWIIILSILFAIFVYRVVLRPR